VEFDQNGSSKQQHEHEGDDMHTTGCDDGSGGVRRSRCAYTNQEQGQSSRTKEFSVVCVNAIERLLTLVCCVSLAPLRLQIFRPQLTPLSDHISTSDPANNPLTLDAFLSGDDDQPLVQSWSNAIEDAPLAQRMDQEVLVRSQSQSRHAAGQDQAFIEQGWVQEGHPVSEYEPKDWPAKAITPDPYQHLTQRHGGGTNEHNNIEGALGVQSAAIPWDYRHYSGNLNSHRKAEPLVYTPLILAKDHDGTSAVDLTSLVNRKYQSQRMSSNPQYANTLSALTDYKPVQQNPTDHWLPQMPVSAAPGVKNQKFWEQHFLDLYAPTPPPLLAPVAPRMKQPKKPVSLMETKSVVLPDILRRGERVQSLVTPVLDAQNQPIAFHNHEVEEDAMRHSRDVDIFAPAHQEEMPVFIEEDVELEEPQALAEIDLEEMPFPPAAVEQTFDW
jgi:hypothetical protein